MTRGGTRNGGDEGPAGAGSAGAPAGGRQDGQRRGPHDGQRQGPPGEPPDEQQGRRQEEVPGARRDGPRATRQAGQVRRLLLAGPAGAVTRCRDFTAEALTDWGWLPAAAPEDRERAEDVLLLVSEVVTNACLHAGGPEELVLRHSGGRLRVEVYDANPVHPRPHGPRSPAMPGGHGLMVLDRLAGAWGSAAKQDGAPGKVVWLEVGRPSRPPWLVGRRD
ncbi:ATP-binding protein [Streptomyces sp. NPDC127092]|uniref:ATP-binding protein n=1 Tax=Streptomyces sp. NPDC127092 TaxID=3347135 RepID=UPI0036625713